MSVMVVEFLRFSFDVLGPCVELLLKRRVRSAGFEDGAMMREPVRQRQNRNGPTNTSFKASMTRKNTLRVGYGPVKTSGAIWNRCYNLAKKAKNSTRSLMRSP